MLSAKAFDQETEERIDAFLLAAIHQAGEEGLSEEDAGKLHSWAYEAVVVFGIMANVVAGFIKIVGFDEKGEPRFSLTEAGVAHVESLGPPPAKILNLVPPPSEPTP